MARLLMLEPFDSRVESIWRALETEARDGGRAPAYFLSWGWVETWLASAPRDALPQLAVVYDDDERVSAACFLGWKRVRRHGVVQSTTWFLNTTGDERCDDVCIEHNALLRAPHSTFELGDLLELLPGDWDELFLPAVDRSAMAELGQKTYGELKVRVARECVSPLVDLEQARAVEYLPLLSPQTRALIRQARLDRGPLLLERAASRAQAHDILVELAALDGRPDPWHFAFQRRLVDRRFESGEIQLLRIKADGRTLGCLLETEYAGRTTAYRSAFAGDPHAPLLCHALAVEQAVERGQRVYELPTDLEALATSEARLVWLRVQRPLARFAFEDRARVLRRALAAWRQGGAGAGVPSAA